MLPLDEMPEYREDLANVSVTFPSLDDKETARQSEFIKELSEYLSMEEGEGFSPADLQFLRSAQVEDTKYWIWSYDESYAMVSEDSKGGQCQTCNFQDGLTPEQAILADYHACY